MTRPLILASDLTEPADVTTAHRHAGSAHLADPATDPHHDAGRHTQVARDEQRLRDELHVMYREVGFYDPTAWKSAPAEMDEHTLRILGHPVMEDWERPYMRKLAEIATRNGGDILEIGFGMGISAGYIVASPLVTRHVVVEANRDVADMARKFAESEGGGKVRVHEGLSYDVVGAFPDESFDGILHDAYPLDESEVQNQAHFARTAYRLLRPGGVFTYFSDEPSAFRPEHRQMLLDAGFAAANIRYEIIPVTPPEDCMYWRSDTILAPILTK
jgi:guanidinoacetate N-methyltransferase